ncbi:hypothetical protein ACIBBG_33955 [Micromonospora chersina]|uniref:hypothetical protein n=1 Tax=Micromonospora chersina TaxID=47854 RepID=UPI003789E068
MTTPADQPDPLVEFSVAANSDGEMFLDHHPKNGRRWCYFARPIANVTSLPELAELAREHLADENRRCVEADE